MLVTRSIPDLLASRAPNARSLAFSILEGNPCKGCGSCCKERDGFSLVALRSEPHFRSIRKSIRSLKGRHPVDEHEVSLRADFPDGRCGFLSKDRSCSIYDKKPILCSAFPFQTPSTGYVTLSTACPPIAELARRGVGFLFMDDIISHISDAAREADLYPEELRPLIIDRARAGADITVSTYLLGQSLPHVVDLIGISRAVLGGEMGFVETEKGMIVPIL